MQDVVNSISDFLATVVSILTLPLKPPNLYRVWMKCNGKHSIFYYYCYYDWQEYVYLNTNTKVKGKPGVSNFKCDDVDTVLSHDLWGKITHRNPNINHFLFCDFLHLFPIPSMTCADMNEPVYDHSDENEAAKRWSFSYFLCF